MSSLAVRGKAKKPAAKKTAKAVEAAFDWKKPDYAPVYEQRMAWLEKLRKDPSLLPGVKAHYRDHPVDFITDWGLTFDPRNPEIGLPSVIPFVLFPKQEEFVDWVVACWKGREDGLAEKSRDMGVTWLCVGVAVWMWLFHPGTVVGFGSRKEEYVDKIGDPKSIFWKIREFINLLPQEFKPEGYVQSRHAPYMRVVNPENGCAIVGEAGDNIGRGNRTSIYFKDESAFYEHALAIDAALSMTSNCKIDVSTPNGPGNPFHRKRHSGKVKVFTFSWRDDPRKDQAWYDRKVLAEDPVIVAQEIDINYEASIGDAFMPGELVGAAQLIGPADVQAQGVIQFGLDVARFGDDSSVLTARRGRVVLWQKTLPKSSLTDLAKAVTTEVKAFPLSQVRQIAVDVIGIGAGVADMLREAFPGNASEPSIVVDVNAALIVNDGTNYNLRAQMWDNGREWLKLQPCSLPNDSDLKAELCSVKYYFRGGVRLIEEKKEVKKRLGKSPDKADSFMLTFAYPPLAVRPPGPSIAAFKPQDPGLGLLG